MAAKRRAKLSDDQFSAIARALAEPRRFAIFEQIARASTLPCSELAVHGTIAPATISHHMKELAEAGLVHMVREGRGTQISIRRDVWTAYLERLQGL